MNMIDEFENSQERFVKQITGLKKQSTFALLLALVLVLITAYLIISLNKSNNNLTTSRNELKEMKDSIQYLNEQMNKWRESLILDQKQSTNYPYEIAASFQDELAPVPFPPPPSPIAQDLKEYDRISQKRTATIFSSKSTDLDKYTEYSQSHAAFPSAIPAPPPKPSNMPYNSKQKNNSDFFGYIIYIQDYKNSKVSDTLSKILMQHGAIVPRIEHIGTSKKFGNAVKYFHPNEKKAAESIQQMVMQILDGKNLTNVRMPVNYLDNDKVPVGQFEIWINL